MPEGSYLSLLTRGGSSPPSTKRRLNNLRGRGNSRPLVEVNLNPVIDYPWDYAHVTADSLVATGQGVLHSIVVNGLTTAGDATIYNNTAEAGAAIIGILHLDTATSIAVQPITLLYDVAFTTGLYIGFDATLVADLTVSYK